MTGLFTGIIGSLVGAGIQAAVGGIPIREDASRALDTLRVWGLPVPPENWFSVESSNEQRTVQAFGQVGQHITGAMQVLGPCMQIATTLGHVVHPPSQPNTTKASTNLDMFGRFIASGTMAKTVCEGKCSSSSKATSSIKSVNTRMTKNSKPMKSCDPGLIRKTENQKQERTEKMGNNSSSNYFDKAEEKRNVTSIMKASEIKTEAGSLVKGKTSRGENREKVKTEGRKQGLKVDKLMNSAGTSKASKIRSSTVMREAPILKTEKKLFTSQSKSAKSGSVNTENCEICQAQIKKVIKPGLFPGERRICYKCSKDRKLAKCQKCGPIFD